MPRDRFLRQSLGSLHGQIQESRVLVVGAGGIGCELLKNLVTTGFGEIHVVDLDTIDLSNLNRQFLFRHAHIKKSKALVAKESAGKFNPRVNIQAYHANIKDGSFNIQWFQSFGLVFNALDNLDARRHVNKMCIASGVPLIESGTTGFNGQVQPIKPGLTQCYDCTPKETPKSFPVCTIRSTPSQPIHCIVWAKSYLFTEIFGTSESEATDLDHSEDAENSEEIDNLRREAEALKEIRSKMGGPGFSRAVFEKVFYEDIKRLQSMEDMWKSRSPPKAISYDDVISKATACSPTVLYEDQRPWTLEENVAAFNSSLVKLSMRLGTVQSQGDDGNEIPVLTFDKDDKDTLDFVAAASNLRSIVFGIETKSEFDIKQMAGNIIPAIATTNATTAALCVLQAFKVMQDNFKKAKMVFLSKSVDRAIDREDLKPPNPACAVCSTARATLSIDPQRASLSELVSGILKGKLGYTEEISVSTEAGVVFDPDLDDNLDKKLIDLGIRQNTFVTVIDESDDDTKVNLVLAIAETQLVEPLEPMMLIPEVVQIPLKPKVAGDEATEAEDDVSTLPASHKRKRDLDDADDDVARGKRSKIAVISNSKHIDLVDNGDGSIVLD